MGGEDWGGLEVRGMGRVSGGGSGGLGGGGSSDKAGLSRPEGCRGQTQLFADRHFGKSLILNIPPHVFLASQKPHFCGRSLCNILCPVRSDFAASPLGGTLVNFAPSFISKATC